MKKEEIIHNLADAHDVFLEYIISLDDKDFILSKNGKWSAGQQLDHVRRSLKPLALGLALPKFILKKIFGKANRQSRSYEELIQKYLGKLDGGGVATGKFVPESVAVKQKKKLGKSLSHYVNTIMRKINKYSENELDELILPHPLLGKLTMREMMYFTIYHVEHHHKIAKKNLMVS